MLQSIVSPVVSLPQASPLHKMSARPSEAEVAQMQAAARMLGLVLVAWEFDDGRYSLIELCRNSDLCSIATLWEAPESDWPSEA